MREVDFSDRTVAQRWREIKANFREDLIPWTRHLLKHLLEVSLEEELEVYLRAARHERTVERHDHRNGSYTRDLTTEVGLLRALQVPRARTAASSPRSSCGTSGGGRGSTTSPGARSSAGSAPGRWGP